MVFRAGRWSVKIYLTLLLLFLVNTSKGQFLGISANVYNPTGEFNQNIERAPVGLSLSYLYQKNQSRFSIGGALGIAMYSNSSYLYDLTEEGYPGESVEIAEEDCFWTLHGIGRYDLIQLSNFKTFAEVKIGVTTFFSSREPLTTDYGIASEFEFHGTAFNAGVGGGIAVNPSGLISKKPPGRLWIEFSTTYNGGSDASYRYATESMSGTTNLSSGQYQSMTSYFDFKFGIICNLAGR